METGNEALAVLHRIALESLSPVGYGLFTVTLVDAAAMRVQRIFSSDPVHYPVGGRKPKRDTAWGRRVLIDGKPLVCEGDEEIARMFDDHDTIRGLGLHSSINAPVLGEWGCIGVLNFLMASTGVTSQQIAAACDFARQPAVAAALLAIPRGRQELMRVT